MLNKPIDPLARLIWQQVEEALIQAGFPPNSEAPSTTASPAGQMGWKQIHPDARLTRPQAAGALTQAGYPTKEKTLATKASRGRGPPYELWCKRAIYIWGTTLSWAQDELGEPRRSTSEVDIISTRNARGRQRAGRRLNIDKSANAAAPLSDEIDEPQRALVVAREHATK
jgi:hypothetical protein